MKNIIITGASNGLGIEIAKSLASDNNLILTYLNNYENALKLKEEFSTYNNKVEIYKLDLSNEDSINEFVNNIGEVDVLINNAATSKDTLVEDKTKEDFMKILDVNLVGPFLLSRKIAEKMILNKKGVILNIASTNGIDTYYPYSLDYDASKAGLINLTHNLARHYAPFIRVNAICPGWIESDFELDGKFKEEEMSKILLNRFAKKEEIANVVKFLISDDASYINSTIIRVDGGKC